MSDIEILVKRGLAHTHQSPDNSPELILHIISDSVRSAIYDWTDVLEEDFKKIQEIENKKLELINVLSHKREDSEESKNQIEKLESDISRLQKGISPVLYSSVTEKRLSEMKFFGDQEFLNFEAEHEQEYIVLVEVINEKLISIVEQNKPLYFHFSYDDRSAGLFLVDGDNTEKKIGKVINKFTKFGISDINYSQWLYETLHTGVFTGPKRLDVYSLTQLPTGDEKTVLIKIPKSKLFFAVG